MDGASPALPPRIRTVPRLVGRRLHTLAVKAGKGCGSSPNLSRERGWMWNWRFGVAYSGEERVNAPNCEGAMVSGPLRKRAYSSAIWPFVNCDRYSSLRVRTPLRL